MSAAFIEVDPGAGTSPSQQIVEQIAALIQRGAVPPGAALPTVRQLAADLGLAPNTVAKAYAELAETGWIVSDGRRGSRVRDRVPSSSERGRTALLAEAVGRFMLSLRARGYTPAEIRRELLRRTEA
jgi:DNA-binding transcriptional regulator YhcF (GntR family)